LRKRSAQLLAGTVSLVIVAAACGSSSKSSSSTTAGATTTAAATTTSAAATQTTAAGGPTTTAGGGSSTTVNTQDDSVALAYTGGKAGAADATMAPIEIAYANQEGGTPGFPEATVGTEAAIDYVNTKLGGVQGHPLKLVKCVVQTEEDGQKCGQQFLADANAKFVLTGTLTSGNAPLLTTLNGKKPVFIGNPVTTPEFLAKDAFAYTPGSPGVIQGMAIFVANQFKPKNVAVVYNTNPAGTAAYTALTKPVLEKRGIKVTGVAVADTAGPQDYQSAITAAGADKADAFIPLTTVQGCIGVYDSLKALSITTPVVTTGLCFGTPMRDHLKQIGESGTVPNGWFFGGYGYSYDIPGYSPNDVYLRVVQDYAKAKNITNIEFTGFAGPMFGNVLTLVKFMNTIGPDNITPDKLRLQAKAFTGPMWGSVGPMACGSNPIFPSLCGIQMGIQTYKGGKWISVRDGYNNNPVDPSKE